MPPLLLAALAVSAAAAPVRGPHSSVELVAETAAYVPGEPLRAGLFFRMEPGWHIYWKNPGDSGEPPSIAWRLPPGFAGGELEWPYPELISAPPLASFGYSRRVLLPASVSPPRAARGRAVLRARVRWLACKEECLDGQGEVRLELDSAERARPGPRAGLFETARRGLPAPPPWVPSARLEGGTLALEVPVGTPLRFFPADKLVLEDAEPQLAAPLPGGGTLLRLPLAAAAAAAPERLRGVLVSGGRAFRIDVPVGRPALAPWALLFAFLGGLLLNVMPCVFPVLSLKALQLAGGARDLPALRRSAWAYSAGVLAAFWGLAALLLALRGAGAGLGWGFQLQSAPFVAFLAALFLALGLGLCGVLELGAFLTRLGSLGRGSSFLTGLVAVAAASPCTAPFMGTALGFALTLPPAGAMAVFTALGAGFAAPYPALACWPALGRRLPRPGAWMETFKKTMSVPMFATAAWLCWVLLRLAGPAAAVDPGWERWTLERQESLRRDGRAVLVDFTAAWCLTCQVNERVALESEQVRRALRAKGVALLRADWTSRDPLIARALAGLGRSGVPVYALYPPGGGPRLLPALLTPGIVAGALETLPSKSLE